MHDEIWTLIENLVALLERADEKGSLALCDLVPLEHPLAGFGVDFVVLGWRSGVFRVISWVILVIWLYDIFFRVFLIVALLCLRFNPRLYYYWVSGYLCQICSFDWQVSQVRARILACLLLYAVHFVEDLPVDILGVVLLFSTIRGFYNLALVGFVLQSFLWLWLLRFILFGTGCLGIVARFLVLELGLL